MDLWVVGAATAAGYIAKYLKNHSRDGDASSEVSSEASKNKKSETARHPFHKLTWRKKLTEDASMNGHQLDSSLEAETVSTSGYDEKLGSLGAYGDSNVLSLSSLQLGLSISQNLEETERNHELDGRVGDDSGGHCMVESDIYSGCARNRRSLRIKHSYGRFIRPLSSLESCIMAQLYKEYAEVQDYVINAPPQPSTMMRPLLITDGNQIISRANCDPFISWIGTDKNELYKEDKVYGVPPLPKNRNLDTSKEIKSRTRKGLNERMSSSYKVGSGKNFHTQIGSNEGLVLFCLGISIGLISSIMANRSEVDKLKELLKHTENLVQDLQEELEMKDSLMVKELASDNYDSQDTRQSSFNNRAPHFATNNVDNSTNNDVTTCSDKGDISSEYMSKIEAELEAELERLGLNMQTSNTQRRLTDLVELDSDFVADFAQGELKIDMVNRVDSAQSESSQDATSSSTNHSGNYAVSPRELTIRLHEVMQSRLEERVKELETALQNSQRKVQVIESENKKVRKLLSTELRYSSGDDSPIAAKGYSNPMTQPMIMNLSGEALGAYNEAYEELMKVNESEEEDSPSGVYEIKHSMDMYPINRSITFGQNGGRNGSSHLTLNTGQAPKEVFIDELNTFGEHGSRRQDLIYYSASDDGSNGCNDDEVEKQLIKQIVEQTKKGSPVVLNAQKILFSMDENEN